METYYFVDYENVHSGGVENITPHNKNDHVHIFYTQNAANGNLDFVLSKEIDKEWHKVKEGDQSLDKHLVSYLGYMIGIKGKSCSYIIVSKDKGYDGIIDFWHNKGVKNIRRIEKIVEPIHEKKNGTIMNKQASNMMTQNAKIVKGLEAVASGDDRTELNTFVQHGLKNMDYKNISYNRICKIVVQNCSAEKRLNEIHNAIKEDFPDDRVAEVYEDVKTVLEKFSQYIEKKKKKEVKIRSFYGRHFKEKIYVDNKEVTIKALMEAKNSQEINNRLLKIYKDGKIVSSMRGILEPYISTINNIL